MVDANQTSAHDAGNRSPDEQMEALSSALDSGRYDVPSDLVADALVRWHRGFASGRLAHEVARLPRR